MKLPIISSAGSFQVRGIAASLSEAKPHRLGRRLQRRFSFWSKNPSSSLRAILAIALSVAISIPAYGNKGETLYKQGAKAEAQNKYDEAFDAYSQALSLDQKNAKYMSAASRMRFYASVSHVHTGVALRENGKLTEAVAEFARAMQIDPTNLLAKMEAMRTAEMLKRQARSEEQKAPPPPSALSKAAQSLAGPVEFQPPSNTPMNMRLSAPVDQAYKIVGKLAGVNVLFDPDLKPQKMNVELNDVGVRAALDMLALESKTFWQPISSNTILVAADTAPKRKEYEHQAMRMFFMHNVSSAADLQEASKTVSSLLDLTRVQLIPAQNAMVFRGTPDQLVLAEKMIEDLDKPKPEVMIEVAVLEVSRDTLRTLGTNPPTGISISMNTPTAGSGSSATGGGSTFTINQFAKLTGNDFTVTIPGASMSFLMSDSNTKVLQNPQIRAMDNEKSSLKIGDRIPVATGSFTPGSVGVSALVSTQFQYIDVGVNVDITPHIHADREVTLKMSLEISSVTGENNIGGITQPVIGQRRIEQEARLGDGEVNLVGGILEDTESKSLSGYPGIGKIPILKYLFGQEDKQRQQREIVFAITPHIIRAQDVTDQNLRLVDVGTATTTSIRKEIDSTPEVPAKGGTPDNSAVPSTRRKTPLAASPVARANAPIYGQPRTVQPTNSLPQQ